MTDCSLETSVPDWILDHPETLAVFQGLGIDYHCGGKSLEFACQERGLHVPFVLLQLHNVIKGGDPPVRPEVPN